MPSFNSPPPPPRSETGFPQPENAELAQTLLDLKSIAKRIYHNSISHAELEVAEPELAALPDAILADPRFQGGVANVLVMYFQRQNGLKVPFLRLLQPGAIPRIELENVQTTLRTFLGRTVFECIAEYDAFTPDSVRSIAALISPIRETASRVLGMPHEEVNTKLLESISEGLAIAMNRAADPIKKPAVIRAASDILEGLGLDALDAESVRSLEASFLKLTKLGETDNALLLYGLFAEKRRPPHEPKFVHDVLTSIFTSLPNTGGPLLEHKRFFEGLGIAPEAVRDTHALTGLGEALLGGWNAFFEEGADEANEGVVSFYETFAPIPEDLYTPAELKAGTKEGMAAHAMATLDKARAIRFGRIFGHSEEDLRSYAPLAVQKLLGDAESDLPVLNISNKYRPAARIIHEYGLPDEEMKARQKQATLFLAKSASRSIYALSRRVYEWMGLDTGAFASDEVKPIVARRLRQRFSQLPITEQALQEIAFFRSFFGIPDEEFSTIAVEATATALVDGSTVELPVPGMSNVPGGDVPHEVPAYLELQSRFGISMETPLPPTFAFGLARYLGAMTLGELLERSNGLKEEKLGLRDAVELYQIQGIVMNKDIDVFEGVAPEQVARMRAKGVQMQELIIALFVLAYEGREVPRGLEAQNALQALLLDPEREGWHEHYLTTLLRGGISLDPDTWVPFNGSAAKGMRFFGAKTVLEYMGDGEKVSRHDALIGFENIVNLAEASGLTPERFTENILRQVARDDAVYEEGGSHHRLNFIAQNLKGAISEGPSGGIRNVIRTVHSLQEVFPSAKEFLRTFGVTEGAPLPSEVELRAKVFSSWKFLKSFYEIQKLAGKGELADLADRLEETEDPALRAAYQRYIGTLILNPNIDTKAVQRMVEDPEEFWGEADAHGRHDITPLALTSETLSAKDLTEALVGGALDRIATFRPAAMEIEVAPSAESPRAWLALALGKRSAGIAPKAPNAGTLFKEVRKDLGQLLGISGTALNEALQRILDPDDALIDGTFAAMNMQGFDALLEKYESDPRFAFSLGEPTTYVAEIYQKSDPRGVVAGNDTACCMPYGSGKNNMYSIHPGTAQFAVQEKRSDSARTVAQSVLWVGTDDKDTARRKWLVADNAEFSPNHRHNPKKVKEVEKVYAAFFKKYLRDEEERLGVATSSFMVGTGYTPFDGHTQLPAPTPEPLLVYSDARQTVYWMTARGARGVTVRETPREEVEERLPEAPVRAPRGIRYLSHRDARDMTAIEGKAYEGDASLVEGFDELSVKAIASDIDHSFRGTPRMSFAYRNEKGALAGYLLAYEEEEYDERYLYVHDLAALPGSRRAGGSLIKAFIEEYRREYIDKGNPLPVIMDARESTSYAIIMNQAERGGLEKLLGKGVKMEFLDEHSTPAGERMYRMKITIE